MEEEAFDVAVSFCHVSKSFKGFGGQVFHALNDVSFDVGKGEFCILAGRNGSGKSLLMSIAGGLVRPDSGNVAFPCENDSRNATGKSIGMVFQNVRESILGDTALDDVLLSLGIRDRKMRNPKEIAMSLLEDAGLKGKENRPSHALSSGEGRRLLAASVLALGRDVIFFDEPYSNLDYPGVREMNRMIARLKDEGRTIVLITHELEKCLGLADKLFVLDNGVLVYSGNPEGALGSLNKWGIREPEVAAKGIKSLVWL